MDLTLYQDYSYENDDVLIARELLLQTDEVKNNIESGMSLMYTGDKEEIDGNECLIFALGTNNEDSFVQEILYGVSKTQIYVYDVIDDKWIVLGEG